MPKGSVFPKVAVKKPSRSNVNLSTTRRFSCNLGTLIPALTLPVQSGDKVHMSISALVKTLPFVAPLMGSFKIQMDTFYFPYRYYNSWLHDDRTDFDPYDIKFPLFRSALISTIGDDKKFVQASYPFYNYIAPGSLLNYLGVGTDFMPFVASDFGYKSDLFGNFEDESSSQSDVGVFSSYRYLNAVPILGYWDIFRSYYANTQERLFPYITFNGSDLVSGTESDSTGMFSYTIAYSYLDIIDDARQTILKTDGNQHLIIPLYNYAGSQSGIGATDVSPFPLNYGQGVSPYSPWNSYVAQGGLALKTFRSDRFTTWLNADTYYKNMASSSMLVSNVPTNLSAFKIDDNAIIANYSTINANQLGITAAYSSAPTSRVGETQFSDLTLGGDAVNKYQTWDGYGLSFIRNNNGIFPIDNAQYTGVLGGTVYGAQHPREWNQFQLVGGNDPAHYEAYDGASTTSPSSIPNDWSSRGNVAIGRLSMDALYFASHLDRMLKRTQLAGGRYSDWNYVQYGNSIRAIVETPTFIRSHSFTLACEDVVQTSSSTEDSPLGSLGGRGRAGAVGRHVNFYVPEHGFMMTIFSIMPNVDYAQGIQWYLRQTSLGDIHVPVLDGIGFQDLISDDMTTAYTVTPLTGVGNIDNDYHDGYIGIGKQPAFIEWMTNENRIYGDFADPDRLMYMVLVRRFTSWYLNDSSTSSKALSFEAGGNTIIAGGLNSGSGSDSSDSDEETTPGGSVSTKPGLSVDTTPSIGSGVQSPVVSSPSTSTSDGSSTSSQSVSSVSSFTSYIDPRDWNYCFADTSLSAQNFWVQLAFHITAKRVISKKIMPHL